MMTGTPSDRICVKFYDEPRCEVWADAVDLSQIDTDQLIEIGAGIEVERRMLFFAAA